MKRFLAIFAVLVCVVTLCACEYDKDGDKGYEPRGEYVLPTSDRAEQGSVPYAVAKLIEGGQVVRDYYEMTVDAIGAEEGYCIRTNGINVEMYRFKEDNEFFKKIKELGAYPIMDQEGNVLATNRAVINGNLVMMIPTNTNATLMDITAQNDKLAKRFEELKL